MAKEVYPKGSIIYKILIVILVVGLIATLIYPKHLWDIEDQNTKQCHQNMLHLLYAEYTYLSETSAFNDTLAKVIEFIKNDTTGVALKTFTNSDSVLLNEIIDYFSEEQLSIAKIDSIVDPSTGVKQSKMVMIDTKILIDSLQDYGEKYDIDTTGALILNSLRVNPEYSEKIDSISLGILEASSICPTTSDVYKLEYIDTSVVKVVNIICPVDSSDILTVNSDFLLSKIGGLSVENHGRIDNGQVSWK